MSEKRFNVEEAQHAQIQYCRERNVPHFAPWSGTCYSCHRQIYEGPNGIDVETAGKRLITGCPYCRASYCD